MRSGRDARRARSLPRRVTPASGAMISSTRPRSEASMPKLRFNHMELTFPPGTLTDEFRREVDAVFADILGWRAVDADVVGQRTHILLPDDGQFILLAEGKKWMDSPGYDHLG